MGFGLSSWNDDDDEFLDKKDKYSDRESSYPSVSCGVTSCTYNRYGSCRKVSSIKINSSGVCESASRTLADNDEGRHW
jgi:hypothetical protein